MSQGEGISVTPKNPDWLAGFLACLDLIKHRIANAETVDDIMDSLQGIEAAVKEKQVEQLIEELAIL